MDENLSRGYIQFGRGAQTEPRRGVGPGGTDVTPPADRCSGIYLSLILAGVGFLLPYNSFIIAVDYFQDRYPGTTIVFDMSLVYILVAFCAVLANNILVESLALNIRITFGYVVSFFTLLFVATCEIWWELFDKDVSYTINLLAVAIVALGCTVQQSSFYGYTSMLPKRYTQAVMTGESAAGFIISINRIFTKLLLDDERINTIIFFIISIITVGICFTLHQVVRRTNFVQFYLNLCKDRREGEQPTSVETSEEVGLVDILENSSNKPTYGVLSPERDPPDSAFQSCENLPQFSDVQLDTPMEEYRSPPTFSGDDVMFRMRERYGHAYSSSRRLWTAIRDGAIARWEVTKHVWPYMVSICLAYFVTLSLFPGIESEIISCRLGSWMPVILMAIFNAADLLGKILASIPYDWTRAQLVSFSLARMLIIPPMFMCALYPRHHFISWEGWSMFFSFILGITNGVFGSVPMILAPTKVPDERRELTGNTMTLFYSLGLTSGSLVAYLLDAMLGPRVSNLCSPPRVLDLFVSTSTSTLAPAGITSTLVSVVNMTAGRNLTGLITNRTH